MVAKAADRYCPGSKMISLHDSDIVLLADLFSKDPDREKLQHMCKSIEISRDYLLTLKGQLEHLQLLIQLERAGFLDQFLMIMLFSPINSDIYSPQIVEHERLRHRVIEYFGFTMHNLGAGNDAISLRQIPRKPETADARQTRHRRQLYSWICRIYGESRAIGTGVLVAPNLLLTCFHCLKSFLEENGDLRAGSDIYAQFTLYAPGNPDQQHVDTARVKTLRNTRPVSASKELDFIIIELEHSIGEVELPGYDSQKVGWLGIERFVELLSDRDRHLTLLGYREDGAFSEMQADFAGFDACGRVYYQALTEEGVSGSLILSGDTFQSIGIHCGRRSVAYTEQYYRGYGLSFAQIWRHLGHDGLSERFPLNPHDPGLRQSRGSSLVPNVSSTLPAVRDIKQHVFKANVDNRVLPVIDRARFVRHVVELRDKLQSKAKPPILITGGSGSGRTFTAHLLKHLLADRNDKVIRVSLPDLVAHDNDEPRALFSALLHHLQEAGLPTTTDKGIAKKNIGVQPTRAAINFVDALVHVLNRPGYADIIEPLWFVIDDVERERLSDAGFEFLSHLAGRSRDIPCLTLVIITDNQIKLPGARSIFVDLLREINRESIQHFLRRATTHDGWSLDDGKIERFLDTHWPQIEQQPQRQRLRRASEIITNELLGGGQSTAGSAPSRRLDAARPLQETGIDG